MKFLYNLAVKIFICISLALSITKADNYKRNKDIDVLHYTFNLTLNDSTDCIKGETEITIKFLKSGITSFSLDLACFDSLSNKGMLVSIAESNGQNVNFSQKSDKLFLTFSPKSVKNTTKTFRIFYSGIPTDGLIISKNKYGDRTFFGDNWPDRAHYWLPTVDHPYDKAACDFIVTAPSVYKVIANGLLIKESDIGNNMHLTHWKESIPIPTKVMVIGAAKFAVQHIQDSTCIPVESWVYPQDKGIGFYDFSPAKEIIDYFSKLIGPFPYEKLANVESKTIYGGMENAGAIFYAENEITGTRKCLVTVAHEIAHQWFGDAVTEADWHHIWLSEGFATYFQNIFIEHRFGRDSLMNSLNTEKKQIILYARSKPNSAIVDTTINNLNDLLSINTYQKAGWVLRMLQNVLGYDIFMKGIKLYYKTYRNSNTLTKDFEHVMEKVSGKKLSWFFNEWIYRPGVPVIKGSWNYDSRLKQLAIKIHQDKGNDGLYQLPAEIGICYSDTGKNTIKKIFINSINQRYKFNLKSKPVSVALDPGNLLLMDADFKEER